MNESDKDFFDVLKDPEGFAQSTPEKSGFVEKIKKIINKIKSPQNIDSEVKTPLDSFKDESNP
jgi:hypothetical protein